MEYHYYIVDTSAVIADRRLDRYSEIYSLEHPALFVLIPEVMRELDNLPPGGIFDRNKNREYTNVIRDAIRSGRKLSRGIKLNDCDDYLALYRPKIRPDWKQVPWLSSNTDVSIISLALQWQKEKKRVYVLARDTLIQVSCHELGIPYKYISPPELEVPEKPTLTVPIDDKLKPWSPSLEDSDSTTD